MKKLKEAGEQLAILQEKLAVQRIAVVEKTTACEALLQEITVATQRAEEKKAMAEEKGKEIAEQSKVIEVEKVSHPNVVLRRLYIAGKSLFMVFILVIW